MNPVGLSHCLGLLFRQISAGNQQNQGRFVSLFDWKGAKNRLRLQKLAVQLYVRALLRRSAQIRFS